MNYQWKWIAILAALFLLLGGAYLLYDKLSAGYAPDITPSLPQSKETETTANEETEASTETESDAATESESTAESETTEESEATAESESEQQSNSHAVPTITLFTYEGEEVSLSDFKGKPVVLNLWASWCPACKAAMPTFEETYRAVGDDVHFVMVNLTDNISETKKSASDYITQMGYTFPVYYDETEQAFLSFINYTGGSIPATFFIDSNGNLKGYYVGQLLPSIMEQGLALIAD